MSVLYSVPAGIARPLSDEDEEEEEEVLVLLGTPVLIESRISLRS